MVMRYTLLYIIPLFLLLSCSGKTEQEERYAEIVSQWQGREIKLPAVMTDFLTGDTINLDDADFTILTYIDSAGCTGCKMKLPLWNEFITAIDSVSQYYVNIIMIINQNNKDKEVRYLLKRDGFVGHVYFDKENIIGDQNSFPHQDELQTFIIDKRFRVLAMGNPVQYNGITKIYKSILTGKFIFDTEGTLAVFSKEGSWNIGKINKEEDLSHTFTLYNTRNDTLHIKKVLPSCDCIEILNQPKYILPLDSIKLMVKFNDNGTENEYFDRFVSIYYSEIDNPSILKIY